MTYPAYDACRRWTQRSQPQGTWCSIRRQRKRATSGLASRCRRFRCCTVQQVRQRICAVCSVNFKRSTVVLSAVTKGRHPMKVLSCAPAGPARQRLAGTDGRGSPRRHHCPRIGRFRVTATQQRRGPRRAAASQRKRIRLGPRRGPSSTWLGCAEARSRGDPRPAAGDGGTGRISRGGGRRAHGRGASGGGCHRSAGSRGRVQCDACRHGQGAA